MNNLFILGLIVLISIIICYVLKDRLSIKEGNLSDLSIVDLDAYQKEMCEHKREVKMRLESPSCTNDDKCDHITLGKKPKIIQNLDGSISTKEVERISCEGLANMDNKTSVEKQIDSCESAKTCEELGDHCGYCDDNNPPYGLGRFMWTNRGKKGSGDETVLDDVSHLKKPCPKNRWYYGDVEACKKAMERKKCALIKSCDDFEKYADIIPEGMCGFCPTLGKAVPINKIGERNVPKYQPEDTCMGGEALKKYGTLNAKQCTKFMKENPCVRPQYWTGIPDHSPECYEKLYKNKGVGGRDGKKNKDWWKFDNNRRRFNIHREVLNAPGYNYAPVPYILKVFKNKAGKIQSKCYEVASNSWNWLTGVSMDACTHQDEKRVPNMHCQKEKWDEIEEAKRTTGHISPWKVNYSINNRCPEGFGVMGGKKEGYRNRTDWLRQNMPGLLDNIRADRWYVTNYYKAKKEMNKGDESWKRFLKEIEGVMYGGETYPKRVRATRLLKGWGHDPPPPPPLKEGDYVEFKYKMHVFRGILYKKKGPDCNVMWDFYKNKNTGEKKIRGPTYGICHSTNEANKGKFHLGSCVEGIKGNAFKDGGETCKKKRESIKKTACNVPYNTNTMSKNEQRGWFGYPQYPSIRGSNSVGRQVGDWPRGKVKDVYLRIIRRCKPSSEGCAPSDYNCEDALEIANKVYKKPQDCAYSVSGYSDCSRKCDGGWKSRNYKIIWPAKGPDARKCPIGPNTKGYQTKIAWRRCNTGPCHEHKYRNIKLRWCGSGGKNDPNCVGGWWGSGSGSKDGACYTMRDEGRNGGIRGRKGDMMGIGQCQDGSPYSAGEMLKGGANFYLRPTSKADVYKFQWYPHNWRKDSWWTGYHNARKQGIQDKWGYGGLCLHPNVNAAEVADGKVTGNTYRGRSYKFKWGRGQGWLRGPTHARNDPTTKLKADFYKHCYFRGKKVSLGPGNYSWVPRVGIRNDDISSIIVPRGLKVIIYEHSNFRGKSKVLWGGGGHRCLVWNTMKWYRQRQWWGGYIWRKKNWNDQISSIKVIKVGRSAKKEWDGLGRIGSCNSKYANLKIENIPGRGNKFRIKREAFTNKKEEVQEDKKEGLLDKIVNFIIPKKPLKEGLHWITEGSKKSQTAGKGYYMGIQDGRGMDREMDDVDVLYSGEKGSVHDIHCDMNPWKCEKRVGIFKCKGGRKNGKTYPFKNSYACCDHIKGLRSSGYRNSDLICKEDCESNGGKCEGPVPGLAYHIERSSHYNKIVHNPNVRNKSWGDALVLIANNKNYPTGSRIGWSWEHKSKYRSIPNIKTREVLINFYARDQGWGNPTYDIKLHLINDRGQVIYSKNVGGRNCWSTRCVNRNWSWNEQRIGFQEFTTRKEEVIKGCLLVSRTIGWGHEKWIKHASIIFNPSARFKKERTSHRYVKRGECYGTETIKYANKWQNPGSWSQKVNRCANACRNAKKNGKEADGFIVYPHGNSRGRCWCEFQDSMSCRWANNGYYRYDYGA